jgi:hypothetical protein
MQGSNQPGWQRRRAAISQAGDDQMADGYLNVQPDGRTKYVAGYYWACICDEVRIQILERYMGQAN